MAKRAKATGQPWADELASHVEIFLTITNFVNTCGRPGPVVLTHRDRWNILRCLAGVEATTGPELALSHESVSNGIHVLPILFERLPELEALLLPD